MAPYPAPSVDLALTVPCHQRLCPPTTGGDALLRRRQGPTLFQASCIMRQYSYFIIAVAPAMMEISTTMEPSDSVEMPVTP